MHRIIGALKNLSTYPKGPVPEDDDDDVGGAVGIDGVASVTGLGGGSIGLDCVGGVGDDDFGVVVDDDDDDDGKMQEPVPIHNAEDPFINGH